MSFGLWKGRKTKDYHFINRAIEQQFQIGGVDMFLRKYIKPEDIHSDDASKPHYENLVDWNEMTVQDLTYGENTDRQYEKEYIILRGHYQIVDSDFELMQFGLSIADGSIMVYIPYDKSVEQVGRKVMSGDVLEFPNLRDDTLLDEESDAINRFYVVQDVNFPQEGYSFTWFPHMLRVKAKPLTDTREYTDILGTGEADDDLKNLLSTYDQALANEELVMDQARSDVDRHGLETQHYFIQEGTEYDSNFPWLYAGDGIPPNGSVKVDRGSRFPESSETDDYFLRTDYQPHRLFKRGQSSWLFVEHNHRTEWSAAQGMIETYINNENTAVIGDEVVTEKQAISKARKIKSDR